MSTLAETLLPPEARLLLFTAGEVAADAEVAALVARGIDWPRLTMLAESERAAPVVVRRLRRALGTPLPAGAAALERLARVSDFRQACLEERLEASLLVLAEADIDVVLLKGAALAVSHYRSFIQRPMADLDLLVDPTRAEEAHERLRAAGWVPATEPGLASFYVTHHHLAPLQDSRGVGIGLDLHRSPVCAGSPFRFTGDLLRSRATPVRVRRAAAFVPDEHDQVLHLCMHLGWSHMLGSGAWRTFRDLSVVASAGGIDWSIVAERAAEHRAEACCYWVLRLASRLAGLPVPSSVLRALRPSLPSALLWLLERHYTLHLLPALSVSASARLTALVWSLGMQRGRLGDGTARPWDRSEEFLRLEERVAARAPDRLASQPGRLRRWGWYARSMIGVG